MPEQLCLLRLRWTGPTSFDIVPVPCLAFDELGYPIPADHDETLVRPWPLDCEFLLTADGRVECRDGPLTMTTYSTLGEFAFDQQQMTVAFADNDNDFGRDAALLGEALAPRR